MNSLRDYYRKQKTASPVKRLTDIKKPAKKEEKKVATATKERKAGNSTNVKKAPAEFVKVKPSEYERKIPTTTK